MRLPSISTSTISRVTGFTLLISTPVGAAAQTGILVDPAATATLTGVSAYDPAELVRYATARLAEQGSTPTAANLADAIEVIYREDGFPLAEVSVHYPADGAPVFRVVEGRVTDVAVLGLDPKAEARLRSYVAPVLKSDPLRQAVLERALALSSDLSGVSLASQMDHPDGSTGSRLTVSGAQSRSSGAAGIEVVPIRPGSAVRTFAVQEFYGVAAGGDLVRVLGQATLDRGRDWSASGLLYYRSPVGGNGTYIEALGGNTVARREFETVSQDSRLTGWNAVFVVGHPVERNLTDFTYLLGEYEYISATSRFLGTRLSSSVHALRLRALKGTDLPDSSLFRAAFTVSLGGRPATPAGRLDDGARTFAHIRSEIGLGVPLDAYQLTSLRVEFRGQWAGARLPEVERIALGHAPFLRGYAPAEVVGDRGWGATAQINRSVSTGSPDVPEIVPFAFASLGYVDNIAPRLGERTSSKISSLGLGSNLHIKGNVRLSGWMAIPLLSGPQSRSGNPAFHASLTVGW